MNIFCAAKTTMPAHVCGWECVYNWLLNFKLATFPCIFLKGCFSFFSDSKDTVLRWESSINVFVDFPKENIAVRASSFLPPVYSISLLWYASAVIFDTVALFFQAWDQGS